MPDTYIGSIEELHHYGVKGMRWGVIREDETGGQRKVVAEDPARMARNSQKAQKYRDRAAGAQSKLDEMDALGIKSPEMRRLYGRAVDQNDHLFAIVNGKTKAQALAEAQRQQTKLRDIAVSDAAAKEQGKLSRGQKQAIAGGVAAIAVVAAVGLYSAPDIMTRNAKAGEKITYNNMMRRYGKRSNEFAGSKLKDINLLDDVDHVVPKGTVFKRMTSIKDEKLGDRMYTTYTDADNLKYQGIYGAALRSRTNTKQLYVTSMQSKTEIRSPSHKKRVTALRDILDDEVDGIKAKTAFGEINVGKMRVRDYISTYVTPDRASSGDNDNFVREAYNPFARSLVQRNAVNDHYFNRIRSQGYNALLDDNDRGQLSDAPMILLNALQDFNAPTQIPLSFSMEQQARRNLSELLESYGQ